MKRYCLAFLATAVAIAAPALLADNGLQVTPPKSATDLEQIGSTFADEKTTKDVQVLLASVVNDGLTESHFNSLVAHLSKADRDRIGEFKTQKFEDLNRVISMFRADFKSKYNQEFDIRPEHFKDAVVYAGKDKNSATVSLAEGSFLGKGKNPVTPKEAAIPAKPIVGDVLTLNLINENALVPAWKINIPNQIAGEQLKGNLIKHIQMLDDQKSTWAADAGSCYHAAAYHVLQALTDSSLASER